MSETPEVDPLDNIYQDEDFGKPEIQDKELPLYIRRSGVPQEIGGLVITTGPEGTLITGYITQSSDGKEFTDLLMSGICGGLTLGAAVDGSKLPKL